MRALMTSLERKKWAFIGLSLLGLCFSTGDLEAKKSKYKLEMPTPAAIEVTVNDEVDAIHNLVARTEANLEKQKELEELIVRYREEQELFMKKDDPSRRLVRMVTLSKKIQRCMKQQHLEALFSEQFLQELTVFTQMGRSEDG